jgi:hypothetical protein
MIQVSPALDRLLDTVADVANDMRDEGTKPIQRTSFLLVGWWKPFHRFLESLSHQTARRDLPSG